MIRRIIAIVLIVLGLSTIGAAIASATVWKPPESVTVPLPNEPSAAYVISEPGVLNIVNESVTITLTAPDGEAPVFLGMGRTGDVEAWVESSDHGRITGLSSWDALTYDEVAALIPLTTDESEGEDAPAEDEAETEPANPADSDMWVEQVNGIGSLTYTWQETPGRWSMIVATDGASPAPMVEFTWDREVPTPALVPGIILGAVVLIAGVLLLLSAVIRRPEAEAEDEDETEQTELDEAGAKTETQEASPEEIMAGVAAATEQEESAGAGDAFAPTGAEGLATDRDYPHHLSSEDEDDRPIAEGEEAAGAAVVPPTEEAASAAPEEEPVPLEPDAEPARPLTRRQIRERERQRERDEALAGPGPRGPEQWPTQGAMAVAPARPERRRWWRRRSQAPLPPPPTGPIVIDDDTGEIVITGEIDVSNLTPRVTASSWRATWGLDQDTPTKWVPVVKEREGEDDEE